MKGSYRDNLKVLRRQRPFKAMAGARDRPAMRTARCSGARSEPRAAAVEFGEAGYGGHVHREGDYGGGRCRRQATESGETRGGRIDDVRVSCCWAR
jgi:hypothetical protein